MHYSFKLKYLKKDKESPVYFHSYFKNERKSLIYYAREKIHPKDWDFENHQPKNLYGRGKYELKRKSIQNQLSKFRTKLDAYFVAFISDLSVHFSTTQKQLLGHTLFLVATRLPYLL